MKILESYKKRLNSQNHFNSKDVRACVTVVVDISTFPWKLLVIKRTDRVDDPWSGHYAFPGGRLDKGENLLSCAIRECFEEVGLQLYEHDCLGISDLMYVRQLSDFAIAPFVFFIQNPSELNLCKDEVAFSYWLPLDQLLLSENFREKLFDIQGKELLLPCLVYERHLIWGLTYKMMTQLFLRWMGLEYAPGKKFAFER